ncbi:MAG: hypothetical protein WA975_19460 [Mesorhizobium sp.]
MAEAQAAARKEQTRFDQADRDRIRRTLLRYMEENRIGVPTLQKLIAEANDLALDNLPLKTLQRFLGDTHRSNDIMVRFCHRFAAGLPDDDPVSSFGEAVASFLNLRAGGTGWWPLPPDLTGRFESRAEPAQNRMVAMPGGFDHWVPFSTLTVSAATTRPFATVTETITNWHRRAGDNDGSAARRAYDGVLFHPAGAYCAALRNVLTGTLRIYWLGPVDGQPFPFTGHGHESVGPLDDTPTVGPDLFRAERVIFLPAPPEPTP